MELKKLIEENQFYLSGKTMKRTHHFNVHDALQGSVVENSHSKKLMQLLCYCEQGRYVFLKVSCRTGSVLTWIWQVRSNLNVRRLTPPAASTA